MKRVSEDFFLDLGDLQSVTSRVLADVHDDKIVIVSILAPLRVNLSKLDPVMSIDVQHMLTHKTRVDVLGMLTKLHLPTIEFDWYMKEI